jgi:hypothetical protein
VFSALASRGLDQLSPPEVEHVMLELPENRADYVGLVKDVAGWPDRTPLARRRPSEAEVKALVALKGRWRAVSTLDDAAALSLAAKLFQRIFVLDPLYDAGDLLYGAWHDPAIKTAHAIRLAQHASVLVQLGPLLRDGTLVLAPFHLPGSWDPRPGWRQPRPDADPSQHRGWSLRTALVLLYWADRLDAVVCSSQEVVIEQLEMTLGEPARQPLRRCLPVRPEQWPKARRLSRQRTPVSLAGLAALMEQNDISKQSDESGCRGWTLLLGNAAALPDPTLLLRRVLTSEDPRRAPPLPTTTLRRRPLCLISAESST